MNKLFMLLLLIPLTGCITAATTVVTESAVVVAQERSVGDAIDDAGILVSIKHLFLQKDVNDLFANVEVKSIEGRVLLTGNVDLPQTQVEAVRLTWTVPGVREVINEIQINDQSGIWNYAQDVWVSAQVRGRLLLEKGVSSVNYSVITVNRTVYLMGIAQDKTELEKVAYLASITKHVQKVVSYVRLKTDPSRPTW